jgi:adenylate kinase
VYDAETAPIISYYASRGLLIEIDAMGAVDEVTDRALQALADLS